MGKGNRNRKNRKAMTEAIENAMQRGLIPQLGTHEDRYADFINNIARVRDNGCEIFVTTVTTDSKAFPILALISREDVCCKPNHFMADCHAEINQWAVSAVDSSLEFAEVENLSADFKRLGVVVSSRQDGNVDVCVIPIEDFIGIGCFVGVRKSVEAIAKLVLEDNMEIPFNWQFAA